MADPIGYLIPEDYVDPFFAACDRERSRNYGSKSLQLPTDELLVTPQRPQVVCLLGDLGSGESGRALVMQYIPVSSGTKIIDIAAIGWPIFGSTQVSVSVDNETVTWDYGATAEEVAKLLKVDESDVCLGTITETIDDKQETWRPARWRVRYTAEPPEIVANKFDDPYLCTQVRKEPFFAVNQSRIIDVIPAMPLPIDTPLRAGAQVVVQRFSGFNGITAAEARYFNSGSHLPG